MTDPVEHHMVLRLDPVFAQLFTAQTAFQQRLYNGDHPGDLGAKERMAYLREQALALTDEVHEALAETGWKSWASSNHINHEAYASELADVFIFLMNLMIADRVTTGELLDIVLRKQAKNIQRQDDGYDGVSTKCPACKRAYDDDAVKCFPSTQTEDPEAPVGGGWCVMHNNYTDKNGTIDPR